LRASSFGCNIAKNAIGARDATNSSRFSDLRIAHLFGRFQLSTMAGLRVRGNAADFVSFTCVNGAKTSPQKVRT
jgi:hypothetical protein